MRKGYRARNLRAFFRGTAFHSGDRQEHVTVGGVAEDVTSTTASAAAASGDHGFPDYDYGNACFWRYGRWICPGYGGYGGY